MMRALREPKRCRVVFPEQTEPKKGWPVISGADKVSKERADKEIVVKKVPNLIRFTIYAPFEIRYDACLSGPC